MLIGGIIGASMGTMMGYMKKDKHCKDKCDNGMFSGIMDMF